MYAKQDTSLAKINLDTLADIAWLEFVQAENQTR